jgi:transcriptional regulator GlxA family with amidase domain
VFLKEPGGQSQFSAHLLSERTARPNIRELQGWILDNLDQRLPLSQLAHKALMSERHFARVFQQEVGMSAQEFIEMSRFERATRQLAEVVLPLKTVAARAGFRDEPHMRRVFLKKLSIAPRVYRERFATTGVGTAPFKCVTNGKNIKIGKCFINVVFSDRISNNEIHRW